MRKHILTAVISGFLILGGSVVWAQETGHSGEFSAKLQGKVVQKPSVSTFEERLNLKPLSDEELEQITAGGVGPIVYMLPSFVFGPILLQSHIINKQPGGLTSGIVVQQNQIFLTISP